MEECDKSTKYIRKCYTLYEIPKYKYQKPNTKYFSLEFQLRILTFHNISLHHCYDTLFI